jgi:hypothetical protein
MRDLTPIHHLRAISGLKILFDRFRILGPVKFGFGFVGLGIDLLPFAPARALWTCSSGGSGSGKASGSSRKALCVELVETRNANLMRNADGAQKTPLGNVWETSKRVGRRFSQDSNPTAPLTPHHRNLRLIVELTPPMIGRVADARQDRLVILVFNVQHGFDVAKAASLMPQ